MRTKQVRPEPKEFEYELHISKKEDIPPRAYRKLKLINILNQDLYFSFEKVIIVEI